MPHWPYVRAVDDALTARGIPPGMVRASRHGLERGLTTCMMLAWDVSRTGGHGGIRLDWEERRGWYYALLGLSLGDVTLYSVIPVHSGLQWQGPAAGVGDSGLEEYRPAAGLGGPPPRPRGPWTPGGLDIPVDHSVPVRGGEPGGHLCCDGRGLLRGQSAAQGAFLGQTPAVDQLHDQVDGKTWDTVRANQKSG